MLFNSIQFFVFFFIVYGVYVRTKHKTQNRFLLLASYYFYGSWNWKFLALIWFSTILDYYCGLKIHSATTRGQKRFFLWLSIAGNLSVLGFFKYFNFFAGSLQSLLSMFGLSTQIYTLSIILPIGISFYTFQTMSYTIDIYRNEIKPTRQFFDFALFVAFFPQLVAGPIEKAKHLLPQILKPRTMSAQKFHAGCFLVFWGLFQKMFIADNLAKVVDPIFASGTFPNGLIVLFSTYMFIFQIFCDFAGYSNIARGLGKIMGFDISVNFYLPFVATNPSEFWKRWHISLTSWMRDYLFIPLGGTKRSVLITIRNLFITMALGGLWHGASLTYVVWGLLQGLLFVLYRWFKQIFRQIPSEVSRRPVIFAIRAFIFFNFFSILSIYFRAETLHQAWSMFLSIFGPWSLSNEFIEILKSFLFFTAPLLVVQFFQHKHKDLLIVLKWPVPVRVVFYVVCYYLFILWAVKGGKSFVYFQF